MMELGLTFPLQRLVRQAPPPALGQGERRYCWDLHVIPLRGRRSLLAVHCASRYAFVLYDVPLRQWADVIGLFQVGLCDSLAAAGLSAGEVDAYRQRAGAPALTRTHGRREVAFLNRAWEDVLAVELLLDVGRQAQPALDAAVNARPSRCAGEEGRAPAAARIRRML